MSNLVRRLVSGDKARFKDKHLDVELDLVYVTDRIIVMGFPATGVESFFRNRREDAKRFLDHRHGKNYWVFNFCPLRENSYPPSFFEGRVSRYPFPDHHVPPLAILPLFVREARQWLSGSPDRVVVLHCKAGKGRSGTLACAYLLSLDETPSPPILHQNMTKKEWAQHRADQIMETVETEDMDEGARATEELRVADGKGVSASVPGTAGTEPQQLNQESEPAMESSIPAGGESEGILPTNTRKAVSNAPMNSTLQGGQVAENVDGPEEGNTSTRPSPNTRPTSLEHVLALHTARRMKAPSSSDQKLKQGVSIPSQRRWLYYWSLLLARAAPQNFWESPLPRVRLREIRARIRDTGGVKMTLLKFANRLIEKTNAAKYGVHERGRGPLWISLARYNDEFVEMLERWEKHSRSVDGDMGKEREGNEEMNGAVLRETFKDGKWDQGKMIRSFARLGHTDKDSGIERSEDGNVVTHTLRPLTTQKWEELQEEIEDREKKTEDDTRQSLSTDDPELETVPAPELSAASSITELGQAVEDEPNAGVGVILDAGREVRAKLYMGQVFMGWFWFIPAFHMPPPPVPSSKVQNPGVESLTHLTLLRKEIDFPIGAGVSLIDVDVSLEWILPSLDSAAEKRRPPKLQTSEDSAKGMGEPGAGPVGVIAGVQAAVSDATGREAVEAVEASDQ